MISIQKHITIILKHALIYIVTFIIMKKLDFYDAEKLLKKNPLENIVSII